LAADHSGGTYVALYTDGALAGGQNQGALDGYVLHYRGNGAVSFVQRLATMSADIVASLAVDAADNVYVTGYTYGAFPGQLSAGKADGFVAKLGSDGALVWLTQIGTAEIDQLTSIAVAADGSIYAAGLTEGAFPGQTNAGFSDAFVVKLRPDGTQEWIKQFGTDQKERSDGVPDDRSIGLALDGSGDVYVVGSTQGTFSGENSVGLGDAFVSRIDPTGKQVWLHQLGSVGNDALTAVVANPAGGVYATGWARGPVAGQVQMGGQDALLAAYRAKGMGFGYGHMPLYVVLAAIGAGLHVVAYYVEGEATIGAVGAMLTLAIPVGLAVLGIFTFANYLLPGGNSFHTRLMSMVGAALVAAVALAALGVPIAWCLGVVMLSPWMAVTAYEVKGHRYLALLLEKYGVTSTHA
jgi:hypothetical protein